MKLVSRVRAPSRMAAEEGSGSILAVAILGVVLLATSAIVPLAAVVSARRVVAGAADSAALAGASILAGISAGSACDSAAGVARANGATLAECTVEGQVISVRLHSVVLGFSMSAEAVAGPPTT